MPPIIVAHKCSFLIFYSPREIPGLEVKGFNQLRGAYAKESTFLISRFRNKVQYEGPDLDDDDDDKLAPTFPDPPREPRRNSDPIPTASRGPSRARSRAAPSRAVSRARSDQDTNEIEGKIM